VKKKWTVGVPSDIEVCMACKNAVGEALFRRARSIGTAHYNKFRLDYYCNDKKDFVQSHETCPHWIQR
jgi:hypothetical protein